MPLQASAAPHGGDSALQPKPETRVLSLLLKVTIMILLTTLFFVFLGLATALLLIHLCVASALHRRRRRHRRHSQFPDSSSGFSPRDLKKLLQFRFSNWVNPHSQIDCPICLDGFRKGQWCRKLGGCGHVYHRKCIDSWLVRVSACPLCRSCVRLDMEEDHIDRMEQKLLVQGLVWMMIWCKYSMVGRLCRESCRSFEHSQDIVNVLKDYCGLCFEADKALTFRLETYAFFGP